MLKLKFPMTASYTDSRILYLRSFGKGLLWKTAKCFSPKVYTAFLLRKSSCSTGQLKIKQKTKVLLAYGVKGRNLGLLEWLEIEWINPRKEGVVVG